MRVLFSVCLVLSAVVAKADGDVMLRDLAEPLERPLRTWGKTVRPEQGLPFVVPPRVVPTAVVGALGVASLWAEQPTPFFRWRPMGDVRPVVRRVPAKPLPKAATRFLAATDTSNFRDVAYSPDGSEVLVLETLDGKTWIRRVDTGTGQRKKSVRVKVSGRPWRMAVSRRGVVAIASMLSKPHERRPKERREYLHITILDAETFETKQEFEHRGLTFAFGPTFHFSTDGERLAVVTSVYEAEGWQRVPVTYGIHARRYFNRVALHPTESRMLVAHPDGKSFPVVDLETGKQGPNLAVDAEAVRRAVWRSSISALAWHPSRPAVVFGTTGGNLMVASTKEGGDRGPVGRLGFVRDVAVTDSGRWIAAKGDELYLYEEASGRFWMRPGGHRDVLRMAVHPKEDRLVVFSKNWRDDSGWVHLVSEIDLAKVVEKRLAPADVVPRGESDKSGEEENGCSSGT